MPRPPDVGLQAFNIEGFRGLDLASDPEEVGAAGAVDLLNVDFDKLAGQFDQWSKVLRKALSAAQKHEVPKLVKRFTDDLSVISSERKRLCRKR